jgi:hypothetical protein
MNTTTKEVVEFFGGKYLLGGALIQFGEDSFNEMYKEIYHAAMLTEREECAKICDDGYFAFIAADIIRERGTT